MKKKRRSPLKVSLIRRDGRLMIEGLGAWYNYLSDPYHLLLTIPWSGFLALICLGYILANALFALAYILGGDGIENARPGNFLDAFFFSVQTMASIGYGAMYPSSTYAHILVTLESLVGLFGVTMATGLMFARFSRPTAKVIFSRVAIVTTFQGVPTLMFRTANKRRNLILEASLRVSLARDEITTEGDFLRRIYDLKLIRSQNPSFSLTWTAMHPIDSSSPLYGVSKEALAEDETTIIITLTGLDETVGQNIYAHHTFAAQDILWDMRFVDILAWTPNGDRYVDYSHFHEVKPL
ncbi:ion channel [Aliterella atlantica]|uniref:ATP-sensitive inward rectifier potassium channel 10 n=1 Tax=Aliterella atlantica CENA595 TaxID=1618023 RepID=A0A0D8ZQ55_9CYAN|nr:ion channel [Aliterella atlantica]KJH70943.1 ATP-sensitive inward rectifier potassium channel 10 [Aliterella atlantica CENA595]